MWGLASGGRLAEDSRKTRVVSLRRRGCLFGTFRRCEGGDDVSERGEGFVDPARLVESRSGGAASTHLLRAGEIDEEEFGGDCRSGTLEGEGDDEMRAG